MFHKNNPLPFAIDSYKGGHPKMYPNDLEKQYCYLEHRQGTNILFIGLQYLLHLLSKEINKDDIVEAAEIAKLHGIPYPKEELLKLADLGYLPLEIKTVEEGSIIPKRMPLLTVENTLKEYAWLPTFLETLLLKTIWYPSTVATKAFQFRSDLESMASITDDDTSYVKFQLHNFGDRGASSTESACIGGMAHLTSFLGTDNFYALKFIHEIYGDSYDEIGFSVPATEHSIALSYGSESEMQYVKNTLKRFSDYPIISIVMDTYNIFNLVDKVTSDEEIRKILKKNEQKLVLRPDSGNHKEVLSKILDILEKNKWPYNVNKKGYKMFENLGIIYGDKINFDTILDCFEVFDERKYSMSNIVFGCGGFLMQEDISRDKYGFSYKTSWIQKNGIGIPVCKNPITSKFKKTLSGRVVTVFNENTNQFEVVEDDKIMEYHYELMDVVFKDGKIIKKTKLSDIRNKIDKYIEFELGRPSLPNLDRYL